MTDQYTPPPAYASQPQSGSNGMAIASLVLGILSILLGWIPFIGMVSWILAPLGLIFGFLSVGKPVGKGMAIGGLITSGLGLLICIAWVTIFGAAINQARRDGAFDNLPSASAPADPASTTPAPPSN